MSSASLPTDEELVRRVLAGETDLFEEIVRRHQRQIVNFIYRMVGDFDQALDMSQDVFIRVHQALARFDPKYRFTTWIYRIASNCAIDRLRRHQPPTVSLDAPPLRGSSDGRLQIASTDQNPSESFESRETLARLEAAIRRLPSGYRRLIVLRHVNSLRYEQIAAVTRLPLGTVKNRIFRARAILRREIDRSAPAAPSGRHAHADARGDHASTTPGMNDENRHPVRPERAAAPGGLARPARGAGHARFGRSPLREAPAKA